MAFSYIKWNGGDFEQVFVHRESRKANSDSQAIYQFLGTCKPCELMAFKVACCLVVAWFCWLTNKPWQRTLSNIFLLSQTFPLTSIFWSFYKIYLRSFHSFFYILLLIPVPRNNRDKWKLSNLFSPIFRKLGWFPVSSYCTSL